MALDWKKLDANPAMRVPARPESGLWTLVRSYVSTSQIIRIEARGRWQPAADLPPCGPDGLQHWAYGRERLLTKRAPLGALIGKIGGGNISADEAEIFVVGSLLVLAIDKTVGPLYLTINDVPERFDDNSGELEVEIS